MIATLLFMAQMGFSQTATKHTFRLFPDGGAIEVRAFEANDASSIQSIREHLQSIAKAFAEGHFAKPEAIHERTPDGAAVMKELRSCIKYFYSEIPLGGRVRITTENAKALQATHSFLRFQIREHETGDPMESRSE